jgi:hypothetical protein
VQLCETTKQRDLLAGTGCIYYTVNIMIFNLINNFYVVNSTDGTVADSGKIINSIASRAEQSG